MRFEDVRETLVARGWRVNADCLRSPSGGFWFDRTLFERDIRSVYYPAARRVHSFPHSASAKDLETLLAVLNADPSLRLLNERLNVVQAALARFAGEHGMTVSLWIFGYPSVRATARHPSTGIAVVEGIVEDDQSIDLSAYHWIDDREQCVRFSRRARFPRLSNLTELDVALERALSFLRSSPDPASFESIALRPADERELSEDAAYWGEFGVLRFS